MKLAFRFTAILFVASLFGFGVHLLVNDLLSVDPFSHNIVVSYFGNWLLANLILLALLFAPDKYQNSLGFLFMFGSILKFGFFFLFFYAPYKADDHISKSEFLTFFVPYAICLVVETKLLINKLSRE